MFLFGLGMVIIVAFRHWFRNTNCNHIELNILSSVVISFSEKFEWMNLWIWSIVMSWLLLLLFYKTASSSLRFRGWMKICSLEDVMVLIKVDKNFWMLKTCQSNFNYYCWSKKVAQTLPKCYPEKQNCILVISKTIRTRVKFISH